MMSAERHASLFRNGRNQAIRIPREFELEGKEAIIRKVGNKLIIEPVKKMDIIELLSTWESMDEDFPDVDEKLLPPDEIDL